MSNQAAVRHKKAADHYDKAAHHHKQAAKHHEAGFYERAAYHARLAQEHQIQATYHAPKDTSGKNDALLDINVVKDRRGVAECSSCALSFRKIDLTSRGQCLSCAQANKPRKVG